MRIAGLICSRLLMPLPVFGLAWPLLAWACRFGLGPGRFWPGRFRAFPGGAAGCVEERMLAPHALPLSQFAGI